MKKLLNNRWFVTALVLIAVAFVSFSLRGQHVIAAPAAPEVTASVGAEAGPDVKSPADPAPKSIDETLKELTLPAGPRDPFAIRPKPVVAAATAESAAAISSVDTLKVSAIWTQQGQTYVLINGRIHEAGDEISRIKIESASQEGVWVSHWKGRDFIALGGSFTLVTPAEKLKPFATL